MQIRRDFFLPAEAESNEVNSEVVRLEGFE